MDGKVPIVTHFYVQGFGESFRLGTYGRLLPAGQSPVPIGIGKSAFEIITGLGVRLTWVRCAPKTNGESECFSGKHQQNLTGNWTRIMIWALLHHWKHVVDVQSDEICALQRKSLIIPMKQVTSLSWILPTSSKWLGLRVLSYSVRIIPSELFSHRIG